MGRIILTPTVDLGGLLTISSLLLLVWFGVGRWKWGVGEEEQRAESHLWLVVPAVAAAVITIMVLLRGEFLSDDWMIIGWVKELGWFDLEGWKGVLQRSGFIRPLPFFWWKADLAVWGLHPVPFYAESMLLHTVNAVLTFRLTEKVTNDRHFGMRAGLLFLLLPTAAWSVGWLSSRYDLAVLFFGLLFLLLSRGESLGARVGSVTALTAALLCKENAVTLPVLLIVLDRWSRKPTERLSLKPVHGLYIGVVVIYLVIRFALFDGIGGYRVNGATVHMRLTDFRPIGALIDVTQSLFFPVNLLMLHTWHPAVAVLVLLAIVAGAVILSRTAARQSRDWMLVGLALLAIAPIAPRLGVEMGFKDARIYYCGSVFVAMFWAVAFQRDRWMRYVPALLSLILAVNLLAYASAFNFISRFNRDADSALSDLVDGTYQLRGLPGTLNGIHIYRNGFPERFGMEPSSGEGNHSVIDLRSLPAGVPPDRNFDRFDLTGGYRLNKKTR